MRKSRFSEEQKVKMVRETEQRPPSYPSRVYSSGSPLGPVGDPPSPSTS